MRYFIAFLSFSLVASVAWGLDYAGVSRFVFAWLFGSSMLGFGHLAPPFQHRKIFGRYAFLVFVATVLAFLCGRFVASVF